MTRPFSSLLLLITLLTVNSSSYLRRRKQQIFFTSPTPVVFEESFFVQSEQPLVTTRNPPTINSIDYIVAIAGESLQRTLTKYGFDSEKLPFIKEQKVDPFGPLRKFIKKNLLDIIVITLVCLMLIIMACFML